ncbi:MAG: hypothetical protein ACYC0A_13190 [Lutibacter sp.]
MSKKIHIEIPLPNWTWWQTTKTIAVFMIVYKLDINQELISLLKEVIKWFSG